MTNSRTEDLLERLIELQTGTMKLLAIPLAREADKKAPLFVEMSEKGIDSHLIAEVLGEPYDSVRKAVTRAKKVAGG